MLLAAFVAAGCATPPLRLGEALEVRGHPLPPFEVIEECAIVGEREAIAWRFAAESPLRFSVWYRDGPVVISPLVKDAVQEDAGRYVALAAARYCLEWVAGAVGTLLDYRVDVTRPGR
jgi:hypothetical protein